VRPLFPHAHFAKSLNRLPKCLSFAAITLLLLGCPAKKEAPVEGKIVIKGSNTFGEELAHGLVAEYRKDHPDVTFDLESKGSASGFTALLAGECDIAAASRLPDTTELQQAKSRGIEMVDHWIGSYGVAVILNTNNPLRNLSRQQVRDLFTGAVHDWKQLGGPAAPVHVYIRDAISGTHLGFRELAMENKPYAQAAQAFTNYAQLVEAVVQNPGGIGYSSMGLAARGGVTALSISGTSASVLSVNEGQYPYARFLRLYTDKNKESPAARDFIRFVLSKRGQKIVYQMGFVRAFEPRLSSYDTD
jgi:phosphate transport system substrate-binding protein